MGSARALALVCALSALAAVTAYTVDCNQDYTDCETELSKLSDNDELPTLKPHTTTKQTTTPEPTRSTPKIGTTTEKHTERFETEAPKSFIPEVTEPETTDAIDPKPRPRLLNINVDELQNFANALHNQTDKKKGLDLSDVNLDDDEEEPQRVEHGSNVAEKFYTNMETPFNPMVAERGSEEIEMTCKENGVAYKIGERLERGCEESCECSPGATFDCSPRCKHPYIRRGRRLNDPLCFESPVDDCCSIIACATGNGDGKPVKVEVCRYGNDTYPIGGRWYIGCEQSCSCEAHSVVTCKPRCKPLVPSDKCINVQDPNDTCCEVQVCDVSQDVHEISENVTTSTVAPTTTQPPRIMDYFSRERSNRPLVLAEPIGSVKVLQNNTVQVNLIHLNNSEDPIHLLLSSNGGRTFDDVELKYSNLILNLEGGKDYILKTKETGTKFNFTITTSDGANEVTGNANETKVGCWEDGKFYNIGEEFHIGCSDLCECTGADTKECAALECPNHVGLELMSKGCVRWAPSPPAKPPNCCPRSARCLSDGTCHYNGVPVPNWTEVPISLTGCEQRCFCENGELDCQEVCTPLPPVPPQSMRCPPMHRPAHVNISDEDCCKQWGCVLSGDYGPSYHSHYMPVQSPVNYVTPLPPTSTVTAQVLPIPPVSTDPFYKHLSPVKPITKVNKILKTVTSIPKHYPEQYLGDNITVFMPEDIDTPLKTIIPDYNLNAGNQWTLPNPNPNPKLILADQTKSHSSVSHVSHSHLKTHVNFETKMHDMYHRYQPLGTAQPEGNIQVYPNNNAQNNQELFQNINQNVIQLPKHQNAYAHSLQKNTLEHSQMSANAPNSRQKSVHQAQIPSSLRGPSHDSMLKVPMSTLGFNLFLPNHGKSSSLPNHYNPSESQPKIISEPMKLSFFQPMVDNRTNPLIIRPIPKLNSDLKDNRYHSRGKIVTVLTSNDIKPTTPMYDQESSWSQDSKTHILSKQPNPYETVLLRAVPNTMNAMRNLKFKLPQRPYTSVNLEHWLSQMEVEAEVNRNLGRSADRNQETEIGHAQDFPHKPTLPPFLPTIPPQVNFPEDEVPGYDQNNIHRPDGEIPGLPPGLQVPPNYGDMNKKLSVISVESDSPTSVTMLLGLPSVLVGLRGSVDLRYTDTADEEVSHWYSQVFAPADEILTTPRLEFRLSGLKPSTTYKIRGKLYLHNLPVAPASDVYSVRTMDLPAVVPAEEKRREIDSRLTVVDVNDTTAHVSWRHFTEDELQFIDGIQVRFRPVGTPIYSMTELLHHSRSAAELHDLRPGSRYEASLVLVPPPRATTELNDPGHVEFTTAPYIDPYNWTVTIEARTVGSEAAELTWSGVPMPAERWVRVYRAAHACGDQQTAKEQDEFKLAQRDQQPAVALFGLQANSRCRVWLELFLTNGKVKTSNVLEINTKALDTDNPIDNEISASSISSGSRSSRGDYYSALVGVGIVAALGALTSLLLLLVVVRRHRPRSANITPVPSAPRESSLPPYDNPAYKLELQQETMDL